MFKIFKKEAVGVSVEARKSLLDLAETLNACLLGEGYSSCFWSDSSRPDTAYINFSRGFLSMRVRLCANSDYQMQDNFSETLRIKFHRDDILSAIFPSYLDLEASKGDGPEHPYTETSMAAAIDSFFVFVDSAQAVADVELKRQYLDVPRVF